MKRRVQRITVFLLLGAILNVVVAWRMVNTRRSLYWGQQRTVILSQADAEQLWLRILREHFPTLVPLDASLQDFYIKPPNGPIDVSASGRRRKRSFGLRVSPNLTIDSKAIEWASFINAGWPFPSFSGSVLSTWIHRRGLPPIRSAYYRDMYEVPDIRYPFGNAVINLPYKPNLSGILANSVLYALAIGAFVALARRIRQQHRIERKRCPACAYDLHTMMDGDPIVCPECSCSRARAAFDAPRTMMRPWMLRLMLLPATAATCWFISWPRPQLPTNTGFFLYGTMYKWMWNPSLLLYGGISCLWLILTAWKSYSDRPLFGRWPLSIVMGSTLGVTCYVSIFYLVNYLGFFL